MLILTRKIGESIIINDNIQITIVDVKSDQVRIGIEAPKNITIYRREIYEEIQKENRRAAQTLPPFEELDVLAKKISPKKGS